MKRNIEEKLPTTMVDSLVAADVPQGNERKLHHMPRSCDFVLEKKLVESGHSIVCLFQKPNGRPGMSQPHTGDQTKEVFNGTVKFRAYWEF